MHYKLSYTSFRKCATYNGWNGNIITPLDLIENLKYVVSHFIRKA